MAWDPARPVPWGRLVREWLVYVAVMAVVFVLFLRDTVTVGSVVGLLASLPMYLIAGFVLAKFGYQRKTFRDLKTATRAAQSESSSTSSSSSSNRATSRGKPATTRRTSTGPSQHRPNNKRKRR
jgi:hypothetical protein